MAVKFNLANLCTEESPRSELFMRGFMHQAWFIWSQVLPQLRHQLKLPGIFPKKRIQAQQYYNKVDVTALQWNNLFAKTE